MVDTRMKRWTHTSLVLRPHSVVVSAAEWDSVVAFWSWSVTLLTKEGEALGTEGGERKTPDQGGFHEAGATDSNPRPPA